MSSIKFSKRPVTEPGKVNQYERLVNSTIDDMIADASQMRIVNTTEDLGQFRFLAPFRNNNPGAIQAGLPRIALNKNLPYGSRANIPVTDHEIGHFIQSGINKYLPYNLGKIHPKHFDNPDIRMSINYKLTKDLNNRLAVAEENNKKISKILAETDIVKNSIADPIASEKKINEEVVNMFSGISAATK